MFLLLVLPATKPRQSLLKWRKALPPMIKMRKP